MQQKSSLIPHTHTPMHTHIHRWLLENEKPPNDNYTIEILRCMCDCVCVCFYGKVFRENLFCYLNGVRLMCIGERTTMRFFIIVNCHLDIYFIKPEIILICFGFHFFLSLFLQFLSPSREHSTAAN